METASEPNRIHVSAPVAAEVGGRFDVEPRGEVELKGKGTVETFFLVGRPAR